MKFLCPNCKAKYQISDEKIVGRTLKMDCRRCSHPIVIRGDKLAAEPEPEAAKPGAARSASRPAGQGSGSHVGPAPASRQSSRTALGADFRKNAGAAAAPAKPTALDQWHVAIHDVPVGPMKREEVAQKIGAGAVTGESLCWREGFDDWRPLKDVPELAELLRRAAAPPPPSRGMPRPAAPPAPRAARPPSARTPPQSPPSQGPRPAESARPAARGNVVPIGGRLGAAAAPAVEDFSEDMPDDEPTRVGSSLDLIRAEEERRAEEDARRKAEQQRKQEEEAARARRAEEEARRDAAERDAAAAAPTAAFAEEDAFDPFASQRAPSPAMQQAPVFAAPTQPLPPSASYAAPLSETPPRRRGLPVGAWIAFAGAMAFGATLAVMFGIKMFNEPPAPVAVTTPQPTVNPAGPTEAVPDPTLTAPAVPDPVPDPPVAEDPEATDPAPAAPATNNGSRTPREGTAATPREPTTPTTRPIDPEAAARLAQFEDDGAGAAPINVRDRNNPLDEDTQRGTGELSQDQIRTVVNRERGMVQRCYETATRAAGQAPSLRIDVDLTIGGSGTVTSATARGPAFGSLTDCVERTVRRWRFPASGGTSRLSIPFVFQGQD